jgi:hypothetical protein
VPTTFLLISFYWENFMFFGLGPQRGKDPSTTRWATRSFRASPSRTSASAYGIFKRAGELFGQTVGIAGEHPTGAEIAAAVTRALGFRTFGFPGADVIGNMFQFWADFNDLYCGNRSVEFSRSLNPDGGEQAPHPARRSVVRGTRGRHAKRTAPRPLT